jgi:hypothetical protein
MNQQWNHLEPTLKVLLLAEDLSHLQEYDWSGNAQDDEHDNEKC